MRERAALLVMAVMLGGCKGLKQNYDKEFKASYVREFGVSCAKGAMAQGAPEAKAKAICDCMAQVLVEHHTTTELTKLSMNASAPESQKVMRQAADSCKGSIK